MYPTDFANFAFENLSKTLRFINIINQTYSYLTSQLNVLDEIDKNDSIHSISIFPYKPNSWKLYLDKLNEYGIPNLHIVLNIINLMDNLLLNIKKIFFIFKLF